MTFSFATDAQARESCEAVVRAMVILADVPEDKALAIINETWKGQDILDPMNMVYHESPRYWARVLAHPNSYPPEDQEDWEQREREARNQFARLARAHPGFSEFDPRFWQLDQQ